MEKNVELFDDEEIITLYDEEDNPVDFAEVACVEYEGKFYAILQPIDEVEGMEEDEVIICLLEEQDDETELITPVTDEELGEKIFNEYLKAVADEEYSEDDCDCDDDCGHEGCGCGSKDKK